MKDYWDPYTRMPADYSDKMPFYMTYPMQNVFLTEMEYEKDMERMRELYPRRIKVIMGYVEDECDKMEYDGSLMFDEYPDRVLLFKIVNRIYDQTVTVEEQSRMQDTRDREMLDLIQVLLYNEMYKRRCRHRRCRRWW